jgi:hypothetical protein
MNNGQRRVLVQQIGQALTGRKRIISIPLTSALLEMEKAQLLRLEREGLFPGRIYASDGARGYDLQEIYIWLKDILDDPR